MTEGEKALWRDAYIANLMASSSIPFSIDQANTTVAQLHRWAKHTSTRGMNEKQVKLHATVKEILK